MEYTKGEWKAYKPKGSNGFWYVGNSDIVCYGKNAEADAQLISAAPDQNKALDGLVRWFMAQGFNRELPEFREAQLALAKAEGN